MASFKFCAECNNMLYPREEKSASTLAYACRNCEYQEASDNFCVYRNDLDSRVEHTTGEIKDLAADPTLPRTKKKKCPKCGYEEAVYFQSPRRPDTKMTLFYVCADTTCGFRWTDFTTPTQTEEYPDGEQEQYYEETENA